MEDEVKAIFTACVEIIFSIKPYRETYDIA